MGCDSFRSVYPGCFGYNLLLEPDWQQGPQLPHGDAVRTPPFPAHMLEAWPLENLLKLTIWLHARVPFKVSRAHAYRSDSRLWVDGLCCLSLRHQIIIILCVFCLLYIFYWFLDPVDCPQDRAGVLMPVGQISGLKSCLHLCTGLGASPVAQMVKE